ncbi:MAG: hypothetical protein IT350_15885 [Deltaproteobacteria bacterium]|nr:hypothetical protein [Deltaproteobacteria bacterium]
MSSIYGTLISDGTSDRALIRILEWLLRECGIGNSRVERFDPSLLPDPPKALTDKIHLAVDLYECDILFVHRDAEARPIEERLDEIRRAVPDGMLTPHVCVIPVRMSEAWLLLDEGAIRKAAGNPKGTTALKIPHWDRWEETPNPKDLLYAALRDASGFRGHRRKKFRPSMCVELVAENVNSFDPLRKLSAFRLLESDIRSWWTGRNPPASTSPRTAKPAT